MPRARARPTTRLGRSRRSARRPRGRGRSLRHGAQARLRRFRQASILAVALTGLLLVVIAPHEVGIAQDSPAGTERVAELPETLSVIRQAPVEELQSPPASEPVRPDSAARASAEEATGALRDLWFAFVGELPKYLIVVGILVIAGTLVKLLRLSLRRALGRWERADALTAVSGVVIWLLAAGIGLSVLLGDVRALAGSLGLVGLALSWALQTPIESFTGWLLNSFKGYYRVGDRISVGEVLGDVFRIDVLNTTVWEVGGPDRPPGSVHAEQPTGRLITFPNNEVLTGTVINYTRDFPYVWDELTVSVANESDLSYAMATIERASTAVIGDHMQGPARSYRALLQLEGLDVDVSDAPQVYAALTEWGADLTLRYVVGAREKRTWKSRLAVAITAELNREAHAGRILPAYPRQQIQLVRPDGAVVDPGWIGTRPRPDGE